MRPSDHPTNTADHILRSDTPFICAKMILESLGPTATSELAQIVASVERTTIKDSSMDFLTTIPLLVPALHMAVNGYLFKQIRRLREGGRLSKTFRNPANMQTRVPCSRNICICKRISIMPQEFCLHLLPLDKRGMAGFTQGPTPNCRFVQVFPLTAVVLHS